MMCSRLFIASVMLAVAPGGGLAVADTVREAPAYDWAVTGYVAWLSRDQLGDMSLFKAELEENRVNVLALTRRLARFEPEVDWEVEGQAAKHSGSFQPSWSPVPIAQDHWELNALTSLRWNRFYWDRYLDTSFAVGLGFSWASELPEFEFYGHCWDDDAPDQPRCSTNRLMAYILVELAFSLPSTPRWALVARIHHRSSMYGIFEDDIQGASNAFGFGIKYRW